MNQPNNGNWSTPWLGEFASSQFALWRAGCEWAARSNWFAGNLAVTYVPIVGAPTEPLRDNQADSSTNQSGT